MCLQSQRCFQTAALTPDSAGIASACPRLSSPAADESRLRNIHLLTLDMQPGKGRGKAWELPLIYKGGLCWSEAG